MREGGNKGVEMGEGLGRVWCERGKERLKVKADWEQCGKS